MNSRCDSCQRTFGSWQACCQHMDALGHRSAQYCFDCDRYFQKPSDLLQLKRNSSVHMGSNSAYIAPAQPAPRPSPAPGVVQALAAVRTPTGTAPRPPPAANMLPALSAIPNQVVRPAPAIMSTQPTNPGLPGAQPANTGTQSAPFSVYVERDPGIAMNCHYQSITFRQPYLAFSFEELRLVDYAARRRPSNAAHSSVVATPLTARATYQDNSTQTDMSPPGSSTCLSATSSRATTPSATTIGGRNTSSLATATIHTQEDLTTSTADDIAGFHLIYEARSRLMKLVKHGDDSTASWYPQGVGLIRILTGEETAKPRIFMRTDLSGKVVLDIDIALDDSLYKMNTPKIVQLSVFPGNAKKPEFFTCAFEDETKARDFLEKLHGAIAKARASIDNHSPFSLTEVKTQQTEPFESPEVVNCPFCRLGFYALSEVVEHLETTSCRARPDLDRSVIYRYHRQHDPLGDFTEAASDHEVSKQRGENSLYHCFNIIGDCQGRGLPSFAALYAHLESESCGCIKRVDLHKEFGNLEDLFPVFGSC